MRSVPLLGAACVAISLFGCKEPKGVDIEPVQLVPKEATIVVGFTLDPVRKSLIGDALAPLLAADPEIKGMTTAISACEVNLTDFRGVLASTMDTGDNFMAVVQSPGIGDEDVVRCMEKELGKAMGDDTGLIFFETRGDVRVTPQEGGGYLIILNKNAIAVVDKPWEDAVFAAIESADARNTDSAVAKLASTVSADVDTWAALQLGNEERAGLADIPGGSGVQAVLITADLADGLALGGVFDLADADGAGIFREALPPLLKEAAPALTEAGIPAAAVEGAKVTGEGARVEFSLDISKDAFPKFVEAMTAIAME